MSAIEENIEVLSIQDLSDVLSIAQFDALIQILSSGSGSQITEQLTGTIDNNNLIFTTTNNFLANSTEIYVNGLKQRNGTDYSETGTNEVTFTTAPSDTTFTDYLEIKYNKA